jgi:NADPH:quinone reductase-like Zn-dependent oxidoreductase
MRVGCAYVLSTYHPYVKPRSKVFIKGGRGGTGTCVIEIAKALDCEVSTTCSTGNIALAADEDFDQIGRWMADGTTKAIIDQMFEWEDVPKAYERLGTGRARRMILLHVTAK